MEPSLATYHQRPPPKEESYQDLSCPTDLLQKHSQWLPPAFTPRFLLSSISVHLSLQPLHCRQPHSPLSPYVAQLMKSQLRVSPWWVNLPAPFSMSVSKQWSQRDSHAQQQGDPCKAVSPTTAGLSTLPFTLTPSPSPPLPTLRPPQLLPQVQLMTLLHSSWINRSHNRNSLHFLPPRLHISLYLC